MPTFRPELVPHRPWTVCFYSFRGGVGRTTLALSTTLNLGNSFGPFVKDAPDGFLGIKPRVFVLDFDLEAPGVDEFDQFRPASSEQKGLVEYVSEYLDSDRSPPLSDEFVYHFFDRDMGDGVDVDSGERMDLSRVMVRSRHVMRAGRKDDSYLKRLSRLDWSYFYRFRDGLDFFENLRVGIKKVFGCHFMVVDSRTGLSEIGGICTGHLADAVVIVFQPTTAHSEGLRAVSRAIRRREKDEHRSIPRLYVASRCKQLYETTYNKEALELARAVVTWCEDGQLPQEERPTARPSWDWKSWTPDYEKPTLLLVSEREKVSCPQKPDSFIVAPSSVESWSPNQLEQEYGLVTRWVSESGKRAIPLLG